MISSHEEVKEETPRPEMTSSPRFRKSSREIRQFNFERSHEHITSKNDQTLKKLCPAVTYFEAKTIIY